MSKIVQAVNSMIANDNYISSVLQGQSEIFFLYKGLYKWSITKRDDGYHLWFYPGGQELRSLAALSAAALASSLGLMSFFLSSRLFFASSASSLAFLSASSISSVNSSPV